MKRPRPSRRRLWLAGGALLAAFAVAAACFLLLPGGSGEPEGVPAARDAALPAGVTEAGALAQVPGTDPSRYDGFVAPIMQRVDPELDGWDTEVRAEAAGAQLGVLAKAIASPGGEDPAGRLAPLVAESFAATALRPAALETVFADNNVIVRRWSAAEGDPTAEGALRHAGLDGLIAALGEIDAPLRGARERRAKLKIVGVEAEADGFTTTVLFQSSGQTEAGGFQESATWRCGWTWERAEESCRLTSIRVTDYEEIAPAANGGIRFVDCTIAALGRTDSFRTQMTRGIDYFRNRLQASFGVDPNGHQGIALGDVDGDGLDDVYLCQQGGLPNRLYRQNPDGTLRDVSADSGVDWMEVCRSALFADLDNDGDQDLVMGQSWHFMIMANDGSGRFTVTHESRSLANLYSIAAADYDNDGDLDLYVCGRNPDRERNRPEVLLGTPTPYHDANNGGRNLMLENDGTGAFTDVTETVGMDVNNQRYTYAATWDDYDNDGDLDLYVANDYGRNNLYRNDVGVDGRRVFTDVAAELGVEDISAGMSVSWGDYNRDGRMDIYVSNMFSSAGNRITYQRRFRPQGSDASRSDFQRHARGNTLFANRGDDGFEDVSVEAGVTMGRWAWGSTFVDFNNDGFEDLYVTNGYLTTEDTGDL